MSNTKRPQTAESITEAGQTASPGNNSASVTPKDLSPGDAASKDLTERHLCSKDPEEKQQELLDDAIELSFPASDPPATSGGVTRIEKPATRPAR